MWIKNFRHKKLQTAMIFMIILLCSMLLTASVSILTSLNKPFKEFAKECKAASAVVYPYSQKDEDVFSLGQEFAKLPEVERVEYARGYSLSGELTFKGKKIDGYPRLTEYNDKVFGQVRHIEGYKNINDSLKEEECIIPAWLSIKYKVHIGDKLDLKFPGEEITYTVKGIYSDPYNTSATFDSDILIKKLPKAVPGIVNIKVYGKAEVAGKSIEEAYREKHDGQMNAIMITLEKTIDNNLITGNILGALFLAIGIIMLFVSCIIINFMIQNTMISDAKTIAVYKTMGYTSSDILRMYLKFYFTVVSIASILGIGSSVYLSNIILSSVFENMGEVVHSNVMLPGSLCFVLTVSFVLGVIYRIISKTKNVKPVYALNGMANSNTKKKKEYKGSSKMQFSSLGIALRTLLRGKKSAVSIVLTAIVTIFSINFSIISLDVANTLRDNNDYWMGVDKSDVMVSVTEDNQYENIENTIKEDSRVNYYINSNIGTRVTMKWKKGMDFTFMSAFVYDDYTKNKLPTVKGRNPEAGNEIAIGSKVAEELNKTVGDYVEVYLGGEKRVNLLITGIFQTYYQLGSACRLTKAVYTENNYDFKYNNLSVYLKDKEAKDAFIKDIQKKVGSSGTVISRTDAFSSIMDMIVTPQQNAIPPMVVVVLLVGAINIFCIVLLKNAASEKTNGIYKCLGYSTWHLIRSNLYYVGMVAVVSIAAAVPIVIAAYPKIMMAALSMFGLLQYPVNYNYGHIALANIVVTIVFILSTLVSSRSLKKVNVRDLVQE
ncbi:MAG: ABC transporter permease [Bacillota bacterium]|nr:ABC transporter permease [Bacillota bacterium]